jgi:hypothetical protein
MTLFPITFPASDAMIVYAIPMCHVFVKILSRLKRPTLSTPCRSVWTTLTEAGRASTVLLVAKQMRKRNVVEIPKQYIVDALPGQFVVNAQIYYRCDCITTSKADVFIVAAQYVE